jgi:ABC-type transport system involved in multi-copper enzyme maturation permease subunit
MKLRGYLGVSVMIGLTAWLPFLLIIMLIVLYTGSYTLKAAFMNSFIPSLFIALVYGFVLGVFYRVGSATIKIKENADAMEKLVLEMSKLGYHPHNQIKNVVTFTPNIYTGKAAGNISVILKEDEIILTGPKWHIRKICRRLKCLS